jgi:hypothetical protein
MHPSHHRLSLSAKQLPWSTSNSPTHPPKNPTEANPLQPTTPSPLWPPAVACDHRLRRAVPTAAAQPKKHPRTASSLSPLICDYGCWQEPPDPSGEDRRRRDWQGSGSVDLCLRLGSFFARWQGAVASFLVQGPASAFFSYLLFSRSLPVTTQPDPALPHRASCSTASNLTAAMPPVVDMGSVLSF